VDTGGLIVLDENVLSLENIRHSCFFHVQQSPGEPGGKSLFNGQYFCWKSRLQGQ